ncbi:hypothetical protein HYC85_003528 [Camellia sinensis]|uniref:Uncharacterized protein n=1 Tax=Camellia sinensis TaxID=4442 RepID=A0A7J7HTY4_CAMSI|nr:hypothetical protein HYC85_003528 [Camellia sinensis]
MASKKVEKKIMSLGLEIDAFIKDKKPSIYSDYLIDLPYFVGLSLKHKLGLGLAFATIIPSYLTSIILVWRRNCHLNTLFLLIGAATASIHLLRFGIHPNLNMLLG